MKKILLLVGRDDWQKDGALNLALLSQLKKNNIEVMWEDPAAEMIYFLRKIERRVSFLPSATSKYKLRLMQLFYAVSHPSYFLYLLRKKNNSLEQRCESLKRRIRRYNIADRTTVLSRSSGGRVSSLIADELGLKHIVCLGYPFKHPDQNAEPDRYTHLESLKTPMLIIQGVHDEYGGAEIEGKYRFNENTKLLFVNTNHDFNIDDAMAKSIVTNIIDLIK